MTHEEWAQWTPCRRAEFADRFPFSWAAMERRLIEADRQHSPEGMLQERRLARMRFDTNRHRDAQLKLLMKRARADAITLRGQAKPIRPGMTRRIIAVSAEAANVEVAELLSMTRKKAIATARMAAMYVTKRRLHSSMPEIGRRFGGRDHSTAMYAVGKVTADLEAGGARFGGVVAYIEERLG